MGVVAESALPRRHGTVKEPRGVLSVVAGVAELAVAPALPGREPVVAAGAVFVHVVEAVARRPRTAAVFEGQIETGARGLEGYPVRSRPERYGKGEAPSLYGDPGSRRPVHGGRDRCPPVDLPGDPYRRLGEGGTLPGCDDGDARRGRSPGGVGQGHEHHRHNKYPASVACSLHRASAVESSGFSLSVLREDV